MVGAMMARWLTGESAEWDTDVDMGFYSIDRKSGVRHAGSAAAYYLPGQPKTDWAGETGLLMQSKFERRDRTTLPELPGGGFHGSAYKAA